ncbi:MAG: hypothetical protein HYU99_04255, partial [Deltaproteobacteria bacterium]|nr:hypothetical protein [Deltaproteobacteria bacterium]
RFLHDELVLKYGSLPADHPATQDALKALKMARPHFNEEEIRLVVLPRMIEVNAMVAYDGTIYVSLALMKLVDFYEELAAVFGHELEHHESADIARAVSRAKKREKLDDLSDMATSWVKDVGISRLQEHRADIQGGMRKLNEAGINPVATKLFLEKLHRHETRFKSIRPPPDLTHGKTLDRALAAGAWTRFEDLENLDKALTPVPEENRTAWSSDIVAPTTELLYKPLRFAFPDEHVRNQKYAERKTVISGMSPADRGLNLAALARRWSSAGPREAERMQELTAFAVGKIDEDLKSLLSDQKDLPLVRFLHFYLNLGVAFDRKIDVSLDGEEQYMDFFPPLIGQHLASYSVLIRSPQDLAHLRGLIPQAANHPIPYALGNWPKVIAALISVMIDQKIYGPFRAGQLDLPALWGEVEAWIGALDSFAAQKGVTGVDKERLMETASGILLSNAGESGDIALLKQVRDFLVERQNRTLHLSSGYVEDLYEHEISNKGVKDSNPFWFISSMEVSLSTLAVGKNAREIGLLVQAIARTISVTMDSRGRLQDRASSLLALVRSYKKLLKTHSAFAALTPLKKRVLGYMMRHSLAIYPSYSLMKEHPHWKEEMMSDIIKRGKSASDEELLWIHQLGSGRDLDYGFIGRGDADSLLTHFLRYHLGNIGPEERLEAIRRWEAQGIPVRQLLSRSKDDNGYLILRTMSELPEDESADELLPVLDDLSDWILDPYLANCLRSYSLNQKLKETADFTRRVAIAFDEETARRNLAVKEALIENEMETREQVEEVRKHIGLNADYLFEEGEVQVGLAAGLELLSFEPNAALDLLSVLLETRRSDAGLKEMIAARWLSLRLLEDEREKRLREVTHQLSSVDQRLNVLLGQGFAGRFFIAKTLLVDGELIIQPKSRQELFNLFLDKVVAPKGGEEGPNNQIQKTAPALAAVKEWEPLFFSLAPTIADYVALPPPVATPWHEVLSVREMIEIEDEDEDEDEEVTTVSKKEEALETLVEALNTLPSDGETDPWKYKEYYNTRSQEALRKWLADRGALETRPSDKLSPMDLIIELAQQGGSLPVRFLQLMGQFVEIPSEYEAKFNQLYDRVKGQSKLAAIAVVERNWPEIWKHVKRFGKRLGGGSLMSVYELEMNDGTRKVIRVANPNIRYHLKEQRELFDSALDEMLKQGSIDRDTHERLKIAVAMVNDWIEAELDFSGFMEKDEKFREMLGGSAGFQPEGFDYSLTVPQSNFPQYTIPDNNRFQIEELIEGKNLTQWDELVHDDYDMKQALSLMVRAYRRQLENGQLHGDIHIGNYRVTPDNQVAVLDRTFFLHLNKDEQSIIQGALSGNIDLEKIQAYFVVLLPPEKQNPETQTKVALELMQMAGAVQAGDFQQVNQGLIHLRQLGLEIPLKLSLILRNLHALHDLAKKAGFGSLADAYAYVPPKGPGKNLKLHSFVPSAALPLALSAFQGLNGEPVGLNHSAVLDSSSAVNHEAPRQAYANPFGPITANRMNSGPLETGSELYATGALPYNTISTLPVFTAALPAAMSVWSLPPPVNLNVSCLPVPVI